MFKLILPFDNMQVFSLAAQLIKTANQTHSKINPQKEYPINNLLAYVTLNMKMSLAAAEVFITFPYTSPRKSQKHIPKKIARTKIIRAAPATSAGDIFDMDSPPSISAGVPPAPAEDQPPHGEAVGSGIPPPGEK